MKENEEKRFLLPHNRFLAALIVITLTIASLGVTMTLLGCDKPDEDMDGFCNGCAKTVSSELAHESECGEVGHFSCDGFEHGIADCGEHYACIDAMAKYKAKVDPTKQESKLAEIKADYSAAEADLHKAADCDVEGHFICDGEEHSTELCAADSEDTGHTHTYSIATCIVPATCTVEECGETSGEVDASNHTGGTEVKNAKTATCTENGYTGDAYCKGCKSMIKKGSATAKSTTNHVGGKEVKNAQAATCCVAGYSGDTYCKGCGAKISGGSTIAATGQHPAAECSKSGHHAHDNKAHAGAECQILGHYVCDGKEHTDWMCLTEDEANSTIRVEVTIANPGKTWSYTIGGHTINNANIESHEHEVLLGGYSIVVYLNTMHGYTFTIDTTNGKKVYIADYGANAGYNDMIINGEDPVTITVSNDMLKTETIGNNTYYTLFITIK